MRGSQRIRLQGGKSFDRLYETAGFPVERRAFPLQMCIRDSHCGGQDLIFPHHENEIAQSECCNGVPFARYWMHNGYINVDNRKMSKSLNNFFTVRDVAEKYGNEPIRYLMVASHYRTPINYSAERCV